LGDGDLSSFKYVGSQMARPQKGAKKYFFKKIYIYSSSEPVDQIVKIVEMDHHSDM